MKTVTLTNDHEDTDIAQFYAHLPWSHNYEYAVDYSKYIIMLISIPKYKKYFLI